MVAHTSDGVSFFFLPPFFWSGFLLRCFNSRFAFGCHGLAVYYFACRFLHNFGSGREVCIEDVLIGGGRVNS